MKRIEDILLSLDMPMPTTFPMPPTPQVLEGGEDDFEFPEADEDEESDEAEDGETDQAEVPGRIVYNDGEEDDAQAENLGDDFFGEGAESTRATGRKKFDDEEDAGEEDVNFDELDDDDDTAASDSDGEDLDESDDFDDDDDDDVDDDDDFDDDEDEE